MKHRNLFLLFLFAVFVTLGFASCSNELEYDSDDKGYNGGNEGTGGGRSSNVVLSDTLIIDINNNSK